MPGVKFETVDEYVAAQSPETGARLNEIRALIAETVPDCEERISYNIPGYRYQGHYLIYCSAARAHIGMYPATDEMRAHFGERLRPLLSGKATIQLKNSDPLPVDLIRDILLYQVANCPPPKASKR